MKIVYCVRATYNPGGMERVLLNKASYLANECGWEVIIVTTDQNNRPPFYTFPKSIKMVDLGINYEEYLNTGITQMVHGYFSRRAKHKRRLKEYLMKTRPDVVVSLYPSESSFIPSIKDGSAKVLELHFCKFFRIQYGRSGILGLLDRIRTKMDERIVRKFDRFVVLTEEDKHYWGNLDNIIVIPNSVKNIKHVQADMSQKCVIAVGRFDYQKGFDRLLSAWSLIQANEEFHEWRLNFFGQGEWREKLIQMSECLGVGESVIFNEPTNDIISEYSKSSIIAMTSHYEGFGMVLVEAMSCGVPAVAFDCKCGPRDIIDDGVNGYLVPEGDISELANKIMLLMRNVEMRKSFSAESLKIIDKYSEDVIMHKWVSLFSTLAKNR